jgi:RNase P/RNase MRP subunit p29
VISKTYQLGNIISKTTQTLTLWKAENGIIEISKDTLAIPIELNDEEKGCVFHGHGKFLLDAIVETDEGAAGRAVEKVLNQPFLMLGDIQEMRKNLVKAGEEDFARMDYENQKGFTDGAKNLCDRFFRERVHSNNRFDGNHSLIFAFQNEAGKTDILIIKGSKLVYKATDIVFLSNENKVVLKSQGEVVCKGNGKSIIINK